MRYWQAGQLIHWRWSSLVNVLDALLQRETALKTHWNFEKLANTGSIKTGKEDGNDPDADAAESSKQVKTSDIFKKADEAITSNMFWSYTRFLHSTHGYLNKISTWCESCPCHPIEVPCPLKGRRCNELADGCFLKFLDSCSRRANADFLAAAAGLSPEQTAVLRSDFLASSDLIFTEARIKTSHWHGSLPWAICGVASDCEKDARTAANFGQIYSNINFDQPAGLGLSCGMNRGGTVE